MLEVVICGACRHRSMSPVTMALHTTQLEHDGRAYHIEIPNFRVQKCRNCGQTELDETASDQLFDALRSAAGLLSSEDILRNRHRLGLTRKDLADLLQISESTLSRWETGAQLQQRAMDRYLRTIFEVKEARQYWGYDESTRPPSIHPSTTFGESRHVDAAESSELAGGAGR